jgi:hypothetical protein
MSKFKRLARVAAVLLLTTGIFAGTVAPSDAAVDPVHSRSSLLDTGWGG